MVAARRRMRAATPLRPPASDGSVPTLRRRIGNRPPRGKNNRWHQPRVIAGITADKAKRFGYAARFSAK